MPEKISSMHDDATMPFQEKDKPEYDADKGHPHRHESIGEKGEHSVVQRMKQFGIAESDLTEMGIDNPALITAEKYDSLMVEALKKYYDTIFVSIFNHWPEMPTQEQLRFIKEVSDRYKSWGLNIVKKGDGVDNASTKLVIALEGADAIRQLSDVDEIIAHGVGSIGIQYNKPNALADVNGLTDLGRQAVRKMLDKGIIVDLAHSIPSTRKDIFEIAEKDQKGNLLAYTHGATVEDMAEDKDFGDYGKIRGLTQDEIKKIVKIGGVVGLSVTRPFFQSVEKIAERIDDVCQLENGPESLGIGSDFGGVAPVWEIGISKPEDMLVIGRILEKRFGYKEDSIQKILRANVREWLKK